MDTFIAIPQRLAPMAYDTRYAGGTLAHENVVASYGSHLSLARLQSS